MNSILNTNYNNYRFIKAAAAKFRQAGEAGFSPMPNNFSAISLIFLLAVFWGFSLITVKAQDEPVPPIECQQQPPPNRIFWENYCVGGGTRSWVIEPNNGGSFDRQIEGYASKTSVNVGEPITFYVSVNPSQRFNIQIYRMGWYNGTGGRLIQTITDVQGRSQLLPDADPVTGVIECNWGLNGAYTWTPPADAVSGFFIAKLTAQQSGKQSYIIFVVRDDNRTPSSHFLFQSAVTTYQAYNYYPGNLDTASNPNNPKSGKSLYADYSYGPVLPGTPPNETTQDRQARKVSFNRPYYPINANIYNSAGHFFEFEYNMVRWLEKEAYDVTYQTDVDTHVLPGTLAAGKHKALLIAGHDEYWSYEMRDNVEKARDRLNSPINIGFFGGNTAQWQIRFEKSGADTTPANEDYRTIVAYKKHYNDTQNLTDVGDPRFKNGFGTDNHTVTYLWRKNNSPELTGCEIPQPTNCNCPLLPDNTRSNCTKAPEDELVGVMTKFFPNPIKGDFDFVFDTSNDPEWIRAGIPSNVRTLSKLVGYEADTYFPDNDYGRDVKVLSTSLISQNGVSDFSNSVYYKLGNQAKVFAIGSIRWSWGLDDFGQTTNNGLPAWKDAPNRFNPHAITVTRNVLNCFRDGGTACGTN